MTLADRPRPVTAADVALLAGVSRAAVSHILNGRIDRYPEATKARVVEAAAALDYQPSPAGRSLVKGRSDTIIVVMPSTTIGINVQAALERLSEDLGARANVVLRFADPDADSTVAAILKLRPLAVVDFGSLLGADRDRLAAQGVPCVPDQRRPLQSNGMNVQDAIASLQVAELTKRGTRHIVYAGLADNRSDPYGAGRFAGIEKACASHGLTTPTRIDLLVDLEAAVSALRGLSFRPLGIAAYNDSVALSLMAAAARLGIDIPGELSVIGTDNTDVGHLWSPTLSSIDVDMRAVVDDTTVQLLEQLRDVMDFAKTDTSPRDKPGEVVSLVVGQST